MPVIGAWDVGLIVAVTAMGLISAYLRAPAHKAMMLMFPVPFTLASLALGDPVNASNVLGVPVMFGFTVGVWWLANRQSMPIVAALVLGVVAYCVMGVALQGPWLTGPLPFWIALVGVMALAATGAAWLPMRDAPHYRTPLPLWLKLPAIALIVTLLVLIKEQLGGFMTVFPFVGTITAYEARRSLWTNVRRIPWAALALLPMMAAVRLTQDAIGLGGALAIGWAVLLCCYVLQRRVDDESPLNAWIRSDRSAA